MLSDYLHAALCRAMYETLPDDGSYYGEIPGFNGVYANADTLEECRKQLAEVLEEWILFRLFRNLSLPMIDDRELIFRKAA